VNDYERRNETPKKHSESVVKGEMFFIGVGSRQALKKRYKDLIKIYHPDNMNGDGSTAQEIMREYDKLSKVLV
jgi:DNA-binding cell septation regulator SpoVG